MTAHTLSGETHGEHCTAHACVARGGVVLVAQCGSASINVRLTDVDALIDELIEAKRIAADRALNFRKADSKAREDYESAVAAERKVFRPQTLEGVI